jgi:copper(I)-binding protein
MTPMRLLLALFAALALAACEPAPDASTPETPQGGLTVDDAWARPADTTGAARSAAYFTLRNDLAEPVRLVAADAEAARVTEVHLSFEEGGVMRMRPVVDGVEVAPGEAVAFEPGGYHVMLIDLKRPLAEGERFPLTLTFDGENEREVEVEVRSL